MTIERDKDPKHAPSPAPAEDERSGYAPPAIQWEEAFETVVAASCAFVIGATFDCNASPAGP